MFLAGGDVRGRVSNAKTLHGYIHVNSDAASGWATGTVSAAPFYFSLARVGRPTIRLQMRDMYDGGDYKLAANFRDAHRQGELRRLAVCNGEFRHLIKAPGVTKSGKEPSSDAISGFNPANNAAAKAPPVMPY